MTTYTLPINLAEARELLAAEVAGHEDFIYQKETALINQGLSAAVVHMGGTCVYVNVDGQPSCLIAKVLVKAGVPISELSKCEGTGISWSRNFHKWATTAARYYLGGAQSQQDTGMSWGTALAHAESRVRQDGTVGLPDSKTTEGDTDA